MLEIESKYHIIKKKLKREKDENEKLVSKKADESTFLTATGDYDVSQENKIKSLLGELALTKS